MRKSHAGACQRLRLLAVTLVGALFLAACASPPGEGSADGGAGSGSGKGGVTIAGVFCVCFSNAYVAWKKGFFAEEGVPIKDFIMTKAGSDTFTAVSTGDAQFGLSGLDAIMRGRETGVPVRSVGTVSPEFYALSVRNEVAGEIQGPADLEGRKVSVSKIGSGSWAFLGLLLQRAGLSHDDVQVVQLGGIDTTMSGLRRGTVDAAITWEPGTSQGTKEGFAKVLINSLNPADHEDIYGSEASIAMTLATTESFIDNNPETVKGAVRALDKANSWMASHSPEEIADVVAPLASGMDRDLLVASIEDTVATLPESAAVSEAAYQNSAEILKNAGIVETVPPVNEIFNCEIAKCVE